MEPTHVRHAIEIKLNSAGFSGRDVDELLPEFITDRDTTVGLTWYSSANGPESLSILVAIYAAVSIVAGEFLKKLAADMYGWSKNKLLKTLASKRHPDCFISIKFDDVEVYFHEVGLFSSPNAGQVILAFFEELPGLLLKVDPMRCKLWQISRDVSGSAWQIRPAAV